MTTPVDPIKVDFQFADLPLTRLMRKVNALNRPSRFWPILASIVWWIVVLFALIGGMKLLGGEAIEGPDFAIRGFALGVIATVMAVVLLAGPTQRRRLRALTGSRSRCGTMQIVLEGKGLTMRGPGHEVFQSWGTVQDVITDRDVTLIMPSSVEFYPVPHASLPAGVSAGELSRRISVWRKAAGTAE